MPVIQVSCLPANLLEHDLRLLFRNIVAAVVAVTELGLKSEKDMTVLFPPDLMKYGLGEDVIVEIRGLFERPERTPEVLQRLAKSVGETVQVLCPDSRVECFVQSFNPSQGFWATPTSAKATGPGEIDPSKCPACDICGNLTVRSRDVGYKCLNCGNSMGGPEYRH